MIKIMNKLRLRKNKKNNKTKKEVSKLSLLDGSHNKLDGIEMDFSFKQSIYLDSYYKVF